MLPNYVYPTGAIHNGHNAVLTNKQINEWRNHGFVLVNDIIPADIIYKSAHDASKILHNYHSNDFGTNGLLEFPTPSSSINGMALHPRLLTAGI